MSILIEYYGVGVRAALSLLAYLLVMLRFVCLWCFFISLVVAIFYHFPRLDICLTQSFFLFQLFELGNADARGELIFVTMAISKPSWENA